MGIKLNCDMGESFGIWKMGSDEELFPHVDMANLACGFHAGDPLTIKKSVSLAKEHGVEVGAHIAYHDLVGFGRRSLACTPEEIEAKTLYQIGALSAFCHTADAALSYVKPHGALYNDMMKEMKVFEAILQAVASYDRHLKLMVLSTVDSEIYRSRADAYGIQLIFEVFADRHYDDKGHLVPRAHEKAILVDEESVMQRVSRLQADSRIETINGKKLDLAADSICVHGDNEKAVALVKQISRLLKP